MPAWMDAVEYGKFGHATVTVTLFGGMDPGLYADFQKGSRVLANGSVLFADRCVSGITADEARAREYAEGSPSVATALNPVLGYEESASIAKQARRLVEESPLPQTAVLVQMGRLAADQVRGIVSALIDIDDRIAREVAGRDDEIDHLYRTTFADIIDLMRTDPQTVERGTRLILAAHWVERIGDRVTNIAEDVVYLATGRIEDLNP